MEKEEATKGYTYAATVCDEMPIAKGLGLKLFLPLSPILSICFKARSEGVCGKGRRESKILGVRGVWREASEIVNYVLWPTCHPQELGWAKSQNK